MGEVRRLRVTVIVGPADLSRLALFTWLLRWLVSMHADAPCPVQITVEAVRDD